MRELARVRRVEGRGRLLWAGVPVLVACSGQAFHFDDGQHLGQDAGDGKFSGLVATSESSDASSPESQQPPANQGSSGGTSGTGGTGNELDAGGGSSGSGGSDSGETASTVCGNPRVASAELADGEACIAAGTFMMGSTAAVNSNGYGAHGPVHSVTLSAYFLDVNEVTVARYRRCVDAGICTAPATEGQGCTYTTDAADHEERPVTCVSWQDGYDFCNWDGRRLPTEAEWERAGRGTSAWAYPWGNVFKMCSLAVVSAGSQCPTYDPQFPEPVGSAPLGHSLEGIMDLSGNAAEWVADWFGVYPSTAATNPTGAASGSAKVLRGGGWLTAQADANSYARRTATPEAQGQYGFRCARDATE